MDGASPWMIGQLIAILIMAVALGMDALSLGIGIGMRGIRKVYMLKLSVLIALFHMTMPLLGMITGGYVGYLLGGVATKAGGVLLVVLGAHMMYNCFKGETAPRMNPQSMWGMIVFALSVSIDSFSVGVSLGMFDGDMVLTVALFGAVGGIMSIAGLMLGSKVGHWIGEYGEALGGVILLAFGVNFLL